ncbi:MAG: hypothetical protein WDN76_05030 [Alphaproteobacteria bacterium]
MIAMLVGFYMATAQGAAFRNLRIIAQVLANKTAGPKSRPDDFIMWTDALKGLLPEEAILLATLLKNDRDLASERNNGKVFQATRDALVGADLPFGSPEEFVAVCGALMRTGFVVALSAWGGLITRHRLDWCS